MSVQTKCVTVSVLISVLVNIFFFSVTYLAYTKFGSMDNILIGDAILIFAALCLIVFPVSLLLSVFKKIRPSVIKTATFSLIFFIVSISTLFIRAEIRDREFEKLVERSASLVESINDFEKETGRVPVSLDQLVPKYFESVPQTGMGAYPDYTYIVGTEASKFEGNSWVIVVNASTGILNWDLLMYFPQGNYPEYGYGGYVKKVNDWAYVYE